jgi:hypothetical protein
MANVSAAKPEVAGTCHNEEVAHSPFKKVRRDGHLAANVLEDPRVLYDASPAGALERAL